MKTCVKARHCGRVKGVYLCPVVPGQIKTGVNFIVLGSAIWFESHMTPGMTQSSFPGRKPGSLDTAWDPLEPLLVLR